MAEEQPAPSSSGGAASKSVDLPVFGKTKRVYVYGAAAVVAVIVGYAYFRRSAAGGGGDEETSYYADLRTGSDTGDDAYSGAVDSKSGSGSSDYYDNLPKTPQTDQQWTAAVVATLTSYEPEYLYGVLGKYLANQTLTAEEAAVIRAAWAAIGRPPGNQTIRLAADTSSPGTSKAPGVPTNLRVDSLTGTTVRIGWTPVEGATGYHVYWGGGIVTNATGPAFTTGTLKAGTSYSFTVDAYNSHGTSAKSAALSVKTPGTPPKTATPAKPATPATKPKPASRPKVTQATVDSGDRGNAVKIIQRIVGTTVDGIFGPKTVAAVKAWQRRNGLKADGIVGPKTQAKMGI